MEWGLWWQGIHNCFQFRTIQSFDLSYKTMDPSCHSDVYEGTREAKVEDLAGIRQIIKPLEESGALVRRTDEEVRLLAVALA